MNYDKAMNILRAAEVYAPALIQYDGGFHVFTRTKLLGSGPSIEEALERAGVLPPPPLNPNKLPFVAVGSNVVRGREGVCVCRSATMATRVANALNQYVPNLRRA
jgi:hypothetical protein